jgi:hypothetical protein
MKVISILQCPSTNTIICFRRLRKFEKEEYNIPRSNSACGEISNFPMASALQIDEILLKNIY